MHDFVLNETKFMKKGVRRMDLFEQKLNSFTDTMGIDEEDIDAFVFTVINQLNRDELISQISDMSLDQIRELMVPYFKEKISDPSSSEY